MVPELLRAWLCRTPALSAALAFRRDAFVAMFGLMPFMAVAAALAIPGVAKQVASSGGNGNASRCDTVFLGCLSRVTNDRDVM